MGRGLLALNSDRLPSSSGIANRSDIPTFALRGYENMISSAFGGAGSGIRAYKFLQTKNPNMVSVFNIKGNNEAIYRAKSIFMSF